MQARQLPTVKVDGTLYFIDLRLAQLRAVDNPHDFKSFWPDHAPGRRAISAAGVLLWIEDLK